MCDDRLQNDGAKLVSVNNREEHTFIVKWLTEHAKQGYAFLALLTFHGFTLVHLLLASGYVVFNFCIFCVTFM